MKKLTVIGAGKVARTIGHVWNSKKIFTIEAVLNRSLASAHEAVEFIGAGRAVSSFSELPTSDLFLIGTQDDQIATACKALLESGVVSEGNIVFHLSGSLTADVCKAVKDFGGFAASVHPVKSFVEPAEAVASFAGTFFGLEGDAEAISVLRPALESIEAWTKVIAAEDKVLYHAAPVFACNYLSTLLDISLSLYEKVGIEREVAGRILAPLVRETLENISTKGTLTALTGPIARGDAAVVKAQLHAIEQQMPEFYKAYAVLGQSTLTLARRSAEIENSGYPQIAELFEDL